MADWAFSPWFSAQRHARPEENLGMVTHFFKFSPSCFTLFYHLQHQFSPLFEPSQMTKNIQWLKWQLRVTHLWTQNVCWILTPSGPSESTGSNGSGATGQGWSCRRKTLELNAICCQQGCCSAGAIIIQHTTYGVYVHPGPSYHIE